MAGLVLAGVGAAIGGAVGGTFLGISAVVIGQSIGAVVGNAIDQWLFAPTIKSSQEGPRLSEANIMTSVEGVSIYRGYGRFKVSGNIIWASRLLEEVVKETTKSGSKGGGGGSEVTSTTYNYYANFAVGLCEGEILDVHRVWVDGKLIDLSDYTYRVYRGTNTQNPDSLIETKEGSGNVPAYRGLAYIVFENMQINKFGNRIPQFSFEITRPVTRSDNDAVGDLITGIDLIPGTTEFGYDPEVIEQVIYDGSDIVERQVENAHSSSGKSDWEEALDQLETNIPNCNIVTFVVTWFGDDLRIGDCTIKPKVENDTKATTLEGETDAFAWAVAGLDRSTAGVITEYDGYSAFGGSPNDISVYRAILDLKARGFEVMFYPFIIMDIESSNSLANPYSDNAAGSGQAAYPWRGRITCSPAPGYAGTVDKTATARTQVDAFLGSAEAADFSGSEGVVTFTGGTDWGFKRFALHMAEICRQAGGVDYFCIGTEMVGASTIRDQDNDFPFVEGLIDLAGEVTSLLPSAKIGYAADWSEYHSYRPSDGTNDVFYHLDPLWADSDIDFIGIDNYLPISDWRDSDSHADYGSGNDEYGNPRGESIYDLNYLKGQIEGGEGYDYFYASTADRMSQTRTAIEDTAYSEDWVFRQKDIKSWWMNSHRDRPGGVKDTSDTDWVPQSKPIIFTEYGCPAINKGTNQPNVFYDPKSSESFVPYFSSGGRDDEIQRQYIRAMVEYWSDGSNNPTSTEYAGKMIDETRMNYWSYDARPWPTFPLDGDTWADQANWQYGHWISGRIDTVYIPDLLNQLAEDYNLTVSYDFSRAYGSCDGFVLQGKTSFRSAVEPLAGLFLFDIIESGDTIKSVSQQESQSVATVTLDDIAEASGDSEPVVLTDKPSHELPGALTIKFLDLFNDYELAAVSQRREVVQSESEPVSDTPIVIDYARAQQLVDKLLYSSWSKRTTAEFGLMPEFLYLEAGDVVTVNAGNFNRPFRIQTIADAAFRQISGLSFDLGIFQPSVGSARTQPLSFTALSTAASIAYMDLPLLRSTDTGYQPYVASYVNPWPGVNVYKSITDSGYGLDTTISAPTVIGELTDAFDAAVKYDIWDNDQELRVVIYSGELESQSEELVLNGGNALAIENSEGNWEIVQYVTATPTGVRTYTLTKLLRGQLGTEDNSVDGFSAGARIVLLESTIQQMALGLSDIGREYYLKHGPADKDLGDVTYITNQRTFTGRGLRPYSPVHIDFTESTGDYTITWIRRTRINGDSWDYTDDVPLNEAYEKYEVDVLDGGGTVVRTLTVTDDTEVTYTAAQQATDGISAPFNVDIYQMSDQVGRGIARRATIG